MIINASSVLEYVDTTSVVKVVDMNGNDAFPAKFDRIVELVLGQKICGHVRGSKLKFLELLVPIADLDKPFEEHESKGSINSQTNIGAYVQRLDDGLTCYSLCLCRALDGAIAA